ncbi:hypothetical protein PVAP13_6KG152156 [Panicum virgatum]|uniref:Uncharacterized protein n=1 Tax=Panicum virgatum TaxID=38727 RepID=A0A8T0R764_PANVG|nr:hypothetical protein PVAP13_6KG152156 [Panicum virgatum]
MVPRAHPRSSREAQATASSSARSTAHRASLETAPTRRHCSPRSRYKCLIQHTPKPLARPLLPNGHAEDVLYRGTHHALLDGDGAGETTEGERATSKQREGRRRARIRLIWISCLDFVLKTNETNIPNE